MRVESPGNPGERLATPLMMIPKLQKVLGSSPQIIYLN